MKDLLARDSKDELKPFLVTNNIVGLRTVAASHVGNDRQPECLKFSDLLMFSVMF